ncbi:hypothetical protein HK096_003797 [Nowakowskiella sp. JEL0078]|nr:hypothetical protein HK096_003797 [Nowakowskiella sp. JEL0078]
MDIEYELHKTSSESSNFKKLNENQTLLFWINSTIIHNSQVVRDICSDLADGQILAAFIEKIVGEVIPNTERVTTEKSKRVNILAVMRYIESKLGAVGEGKWTIEGILTKDFSSVYCLLVQLAHILKCPYSLPSNVTINITVIEKISNGGVKKKTISHLITEDESQFVETETIVPVKHKTERVIRADDFDKLFLIDEKKQQLVLDDLDILVTDICQDFHNGVNLIFLTGMLGKFFVPLCFYHLKPESDEEKLLNVKLALQLMADLDMDMSKLNPEDIINKDLKGISRCLYSIFHAFTEEEKDDTEEVEESGKMTQ